MQDDPPEDVIEDDDFFGEEVAVTAPAPAPGMTTRNLRRGIR